LQNNIILYCKHKVFFNNDLDWINYPIDNMNDNI